jgi:hypothetical protein
MNLQNERNSALIQRSAQILKWSMSRVIESEIPSNRLQYSVSEVYSGRESNPHSLIANRILSPACLPVPPPGRVVIKLLIKVIRSIRAVCDCETAL